MDLIAFVAQFIKRWDLSSQPVLLALSGGPDSLCLFHCLAACQSAGLLTFHVAHVDHGWREESAREAIELQHLVESFGVSFHKKKLNPSLLKGNLEDSCRLERYAFFKQLCQAHDLKGILLGQHADDQAETVLKRVLEGAHWTHFGGMRELSWFEGMRVFRPWISLSKKTLLDWLQAKNIVPFEDRTNHDIRFLRAKMRQQILPWLSQAFGKDVQNPLVQLGQEAQELEDYFQRKLGVLLKTKVMGPLGTYLDLQQTLPSEEVEIKYLVRRFCEEEGLCLSRSLITALASSLQKGASNQSFTAGSHTIWVDRKRLFIPSFHGPLFSQALPVLEGEYKRDPWTIQIERWQGEEVTCTTWTEAWTGKLTAIVPVGQYTLALPLPNASYRSRTKSISRWWNDHKVPAFIRQALPVVWQGDTIYHEFLTGRRESISACQARLKIKLFLD